MNEERIEPMSSVEFWIAWNNLIEEGKIEVSHVREDGELVYCIAEY